MIWVRYFEDPLTLTLTLTLLSLKLTVLPRPTNLNLKPNPTNPNPNSYHNIGIVDPRNNSGPSEQWADTGTNPIVHGNSSNIEEIPTKTDTLKLKCFVTYLINHLLTYYYAMSRHQFS